MDDYSDNDAHHLLTSLAKYAETFGKDCDGDMTVKQLADDLATCDDARQGVINERLRDRVYNGLNQ